MKKKLCSLPVRQTLIPGKPGTRVLAAKHGDRLVCVRVRVDEEEDVGYKTAELVMEKVVRRRQKPASMTRVDVLIGTDETLLEEAVERHGGRRRAGEIWSIPYLVAVRMGLTGRIVSAAPEQDRPPDE